MSDETSKRVLSDNFFAMLSVESTTFEREIQDERRNRSATRKESVILEVLDVPVGQQAPQLVRKKDAEFPLAPYMEPDVVMEYQRISAAPETSRAYITSPLFIDMSRNRGSGRQTRGPGKDGGFSLHLAKNRIATHGWDNLLYLENEVTYLLVPPILIQPSLDILDPDERGDVGLRLKHTVPIVRTPNAVVQSERLDATKQAISWIVYDMWNNPKVTESVKKVMTMSLTQVSQRIKGQLENAGTGLNPDAVNFVPLLVGDVYGAAQAAQAAPMMYLFLETDDATQTQNLYMTRHLSLDEVSAFRAQGEVWKAQTGTTVALSIEYPSAEGPPVRHYPKWDIGELYQYQGTIPSETALRRTVLLENNWRRVPSGRTVQFLMRLTTPDINDRQGSDLAFVDQKTDPVVYDETAEHRRVTFYWTSPTNQVNNQVVVLRIQAFLAFEKTTQVELSATAPSAAGLVEERDAWTGALSRLDQSLSDFSAETYPETQVPKGLFEIVRAIHPVNETYQDEVESRLYSNLSSVVFLYDMLLSIERMLKEMDIDQVNEYLDVSAPILWTRRVFDLMSETLQGPEPPLQRETELLSRLALLENRQVLFGYRNVKDTRRPASLLPLDKVVDVVAIQIAERATERLGGRSSLKALNTAKTTVSGVIGNVRDLFTVGETYLLKYKRDAVLVHVAAVTQQYIEVDASVSVQIAGAFKTFELQPKKYYLGRGNEIPTSFVVETNAKTRFRLVSIGESTKVPSSTRGRLYIDVHFNTYGPEFDFVSHMAMQKLNVFSIEKDDDFELEVIKQLRKLRAHEKTKFMFNGMNWGTVFEVWQVLAKERPVWDQDRRHPLGAADPEPKRYSEVDPKAFGTISQDLVRQIIGDI